MSDSLIHLSQEHAQTLLTINRGIEREALRVTPAGSLAQTPHPASLGSKLTHPKITTDFSESQLELITPVHQSAGAALADLDDVHRHVYANLTDEILWSASMPCVLPGDATIPLAYYGNSNLGRLKTTYRNGLGNRYGRGMQTICAVHYNFSLPDVFWQWLKRQENSNESMKDFVSRRYFDLMRNFRRMSWLLTYLFGASPAVCNSFLKGREHSLDVYDEGTAYLPFATSLRSGNLGYQSDAQAESMHVCYNSLDNYVSGLASAICEPYAPYADIGTLVDGEYRQINTSILQSEAEFYSSIRAKRVPGKGQNFLTCLKQDGVQYIEVRLLDVNPYLPLGIDEQEIHFLDAFLLYCLMSPSETHDDLLCHEVSANAVKTVHEGRAPGLMLKDHGIDRAFTEWGHDILTGVSDYADLLDRANAEGHDPVHRAALTAQSARLGDAGLTPSGRILADMAADEIPFFRFAMNKALTHRDHFRSRPISEDTREAFADMAKQSVADQQTIESADTTDFDTYLQNILDVYKPLVS